jgi:RHS repeat-associated protein
MRYVFDGSRRIARIGVAQPYEQTQATTPLSRLVFVGDHLGSTSVVVQDNEDPNSSGSEVGCVVSSTSHLPYGGSEAESRAEGCGVAVSLAYYYSGKEKEKSIGISYYGKRYLNPSLSSWLSPDSERVFNNNDGELTYAAFRLNPTKYIDPYGTKVLLGFNISRSKGSLYTGPSKSRDAAMKRAVSASTKTTYQQRKQWANAQLWKIQSFFKSFVKGDITKAIGYRERVVGGVTRFELYMRGNVQFKTTGGFASKADIKRVWETMRIATNGKGADIRIVTDSNRRRWRRETNAKGFTYNYVSSTNPDRRGLEYITAMRGEVDAVYRGDVVASGNSKRRQANLSMGSVIVHEVVAHAVHTLIQKEIFDAYKGAKNQLSYTVFRIMSQHRSLLFGRYGTLADQLGYQTETPADRISGSVDRMVTDARQKASGSP